MDKASWTGSGSHDVRIQRRDMQTISLPSVPWRSWDSATQSHHSSCSENSLAGLVLKAGDRPPKDPVISPQNQQEEGAEDQLELVDSQIGVLWGFGYHPSLGVLSPQHQYYFTALWSLRIFIQKQGLKKLYRVSAAENWAPAPRPLPPTTGRALSLGCLLTSPASLFQSKGYR